MSDEKLTKVELQEDDLDEVTGGVNPRLPKKEQVTTVTNCPYFYKALNKLNVNCCTNCFYWVEKNGTKECSSTLKNQNII